MTSLTRSTASSNPERMAPVASNGKQAHLASQIRPTVSLDGEWQFCFGAEAFQSIQVPAPWESQRHDLRDRAGTALYQRTFTVPSEFEGRSLFLCFGAVDYFAEVWVDET